MSETLCRAKKKNDRHKIARYSCPVFILCLRDKKSYSPNLHSLFFQNLFSILRSSTTSLLKSSYGQVRCEPIKSLSSIKRIKQNTLFNYLITPTTYSSINQSALCFQINPFRPRLRRHRETWREFVLKPHGCPYIILQSYYRLHFDCLHFYIKI